ncbi:uncharacterized protein LOC133844390 [Drosophila sulfurigaster albostrigata]|uniref:uncharacterized protein LOC133844390 n=1 Tax=Drosophila sulfurigaster albostrigata TaxID=89887 RepID=UPI002D21D571|nr:uncharacterized protein LOC133844390 [Drosophila sulfurigaster albostrigata]
MKADNVQNMENNKAEMEYITLPNTGIQFTDGQEQAEPNAYHSKENEYSQNQAYSGVGNFGYSGYSAAAPNYSYCCGYDSSGANTVQNTQSYGYATQANPNQVEYQYEYANQPNVGQYYNVNRVAGGGESYATTAAPSADNYASTANYSSTANYPSAGNYSSAGNYPSTVNYSAAMNYLPTANNSSALNYQATNNMESYAYNMKHGAQSNYFSMPSLGNMGMTRNQMNPEYWYSPQKTDEGTKPQSVYSSDFQPNYGAGNNFNHFPNNSFMDKKLFMELLQANPEKSVLQGNSYQYGDATCDVADDQVNGNYATGNVGGMQTQSYPISNYAQMCSS